MIELVAKLVVSLALAILIKGGVAVFGHWIAWWAAGLISLVVVFGGWLILDNSDGDWFH